MAPGPLHRGGVARGDAAPVRRADEEPGLSESAPRALAPRIRWALEILPLRATHRVLEIGCGHGLALEQVAARLSSGRVLGIDRSNKMTTLAERRLAAAGLLGRATVLTASLATADLGSEPFDLAFAINVSLFARDAARELSLLSERLAPGGALYLLYESPARRHVTAFRAEASENLLAHGFRVRCVEEPRVGVCVVGTRAKRRA